MFERRHQPLLPLPLFFRRLALSLVFALLLVAVGLIIGMVGYHVFERMSWVDAFANAAMILSGMGPFGPLATQHGKIFAGCYALFSGLAFVAIIGTILAPIAHRFLHRYHLQVGE